MNEPIMWQALADREKIGILLEQVLRWPIFSWQERGTVYPHVRMGRDHWYVRLNDEQHIYRQFDPLHNMHDAWSVVECITRPPATQEEAELHANTTFMQWWSHAELWGCSAQEAANAICVATLRAKGYAVIADE